MAEKIEQKTLTELLISTPAGGPYAVTDFTLLDSGNQWILNQPAVQMYCGSETCAGYRFFDLSSSNLNQPSTTVQYIFMTYKCRNCRKSPKTFALRAMSIDSASPSVVVKIGEFPFYGSPISARLLAFLGQDAEIFTQGWRAENAGFGFGSFSYYRRVVEDSKAKFISQTAEIAKKSGADELALAQFERAEKERGFGQAIAEIRQLIPQSLLIHGQNPLNLLRSALNEGVYAQTDAECLEVAASIRIILTELAERLNAARDDNGELSSAVNRLLNSPRKSQSPTA